MTEPFHAYLPSLARARQEGVRALARRWWRGGEASNLLDDEPEETHDLAALILGGGSLRVACLPRTTPALEIALETYFDGAPDPPDCLRIDLRRAPRAPYRTPARPPDLRGRDLLDALVETRGLAAVDGPGWAWPFVWLRFGGLGAPRDVALVVVPDRGTLAIVAPLMTSLG